MENRLGHRFGDVRVHTDDAADAAARSVRARAYTVGSHVIFSHGEYAPTTTEGRRTNLRDEDRARFDRLFPAEP